MQAIKLYGVRQGPTWVDGFKTLEAAWEYGQENLFGFFTLYSYEVREVSSLNVRSYCGLCGKTPKLC